MWAPPGLGIEPVSPALAADSLPLSHQGIPMLGNSYSTPETVYENYRDNLRLGMIFFFFFKNDFLFFKNGFTLTDNSIGQNQLNPI